MENSGCASEKTKAFAKKIDSDYLEINSEGYRCYKELDNMVIFKSLVSSKLENIVTSSGFPSNMSNEFNKVYNLKETYKQMEYYSHIFYYAVLYRKLSENIPCLNFHINYLGSDFLEDLKQGKLGQDTKKYLKLILKQAEGFAKFFIYNDYELQYSLSKKEDLKL